MRDWRLLPKDVEWLFRGTFQNTMKLQCGSTPDNFFCCPKDLCNGNCKSKIQGIQLKTEHFSLFVTHIVKFYVQRITFLKYVHFEPDIVFSPFKGSSWIQFEPKNCIVLPDYLSWIDLSNKIAFKQPLTYLNQTIRQPSFLVF